MLQLSHKGLKVYQQGLNLVAEVYEKTKSYPKEEQFILVSQLRRAVISVCGNLAEGAARRSYAEKKRFYEISRSSLVEVDTQIEISLILKYLNRNEIIALEPHLESVFKMLSKMIVNIDHGR
ncbi:four helix bundle protein [Niabella hirudinis]|uniref:four helix bundle protein n=1 Tax=Niabella hirudinis TaxID=1285929 RepID=UPI003EB94454